MGMLLNGAEPDGESATQIESVVFGEDGQTDQDLNVEMLKIATKLTQVCWLGLFCVCAMAISHCRVAPCSFLGHWQQGALRSPAEKHAVFQCAQSLGVDGCHFPAGLWHAVLLQM